LGSAHPDRFVGSRPRASHNSTLVLTRLDWHIQLAIKNSKDRREILAKIRKSVKERDLESMFESSASIQPELTRAEERIKILK